MDGEGLRVDPRRLPRRVTEAVGEGTVTAPEDVGSSTHRGLMRKGGYSRNRSSWSSLQTQGTCPSLPSALRALSPTPSPGPPRVTLRLHSLPNRREGLGPIGLHERHLTHNPTWSTVQWSRTSGQKEGMVTGQLEPANFRLVFITGAKTEKPLRSSIDLGTDISGTVGHVFSRTPSPSSNQFSTKTRPTL